MHKKSLKRKDFLQLNKAAFFSGNALHINYRKSKLPFFRFGITVTKKWANAVNRNLFKRRVRHCLINQEYLPKGSDLQIKPRRGKKTSFEAIQRDFQAFFKKKLV